LCREWFINFYDADGVRVRDESNFIGDEGCSPKPGENNEDLYLQARRKGDERSQKNYHY